MSTQYLLCSNLDLNISL